MNRITGAVLVTLACLMSFPAPTPAQDITVNVQVIYPYGAAPPTDPDLKNLQWNRYTTENFVILSIDDSQGRWLSENLEQIKKWCLSRWGFPENSRGRFTKECRIFCVPNRLLLKKLFNLDEPKVEVRRANGQLEMTAMWLVLDGKPASTIPPYLTEVCLAEFEAMHNVTIGWWFKRGSAILNGTLPDIRQQMVALAGTVQQNTPIYVSEKVFMMTEEDYNKETVSNRRIFDQEAVALCVMLRKEFGEAKLQGCLRIASRNNMQDVLRVVYGFSGYAHFDKQYIRFMRDLTSEVYANRTPDSYLEIQPVR